MTPASSGGTGSGGTVLVPPGQPQVAGALGDVISPLAALSANGGAGTPAGTAYPQAQGLVSQLLTQSPYTWEALQSAGEANNFDIAQLFPQGMAGSSALASGASGVLPYTTPLGANAFDPAYASLISGLGNNPYLPQAQAGAGQQAGIGSFGANSASDLANTVAGLARNPMYGNLAAFAEGNPYYQQGQFGANAGAGYGAGGAGSLYGAGQSLLSTGFDPQQSLFHRTQGQLLDQSNAVNAMSGIAGTPYGASVTGNALGNFDINWQNAQLGREAQASAAASPLLQSAPGLAAGSAALPGQAFLGQLSNILPFLGAQQGAAQQGLASALPGFQGAAGLAGSSAAAPYNLSAGNIGQILSAMQQRNVAGQGGAGALASLLSGAGSGLMNAQSLGANAAGTRASLGALPYQTGAGIASNDLSGLSQLTNLGNNQFLLPQQVASDLMQYLGLGQSASGISAQLGQMGANQLGQSIGGVGSLLGGAGNLFGGAGGGGGLGGLLGGGGGGGLFGASSPLFGFGGLFGPSTADAGAAGILGLGAGTPLSVFTDAVMAAAL